MWLQVRKIFNIFAMLMMVLSAVCWGIWGFFDVEILPTLMGKTLSQIFYFAFGALGLYGVHLFIEYAKLLINPIEEKQALLYEVEQKGTSEDQ